MQTFGELYAKHLKLLDEQDTDLYDNSYENFYEQQIIENPQNNNIFNAHEDLIITNSIIICAIFSLISLFNFIIKYKNLFAFKKAGILKDLKIGKEFVLTYIDFQSLVYAKNYEKVLSLSTKINPPKEQNIFKAFRISTNPLKIIIDFAIAFCINWILCTLFAISLIITELLPNNFLGNTIFVLMLAFLYLFILPFYAKSKLTIDALSGFDGDDDKMVRETGKLFGINLFNDDFCQTVKMLDENKAQTNLAKHFKIYLKHFNKTEQEIFNNTSSTFL